jgi:hypothetical protein
VCGKAFRWDCTQKKGGRAPKGRIRSFQTQAGRKENHQNHQNEDGGRNGRNQRDGNQKDGKRKNQKRDEDRRERERKQNGNEQHPTNGKTPPTWQRRN